VLGRALGVSTGFTTTFAVLQLRYDCGVGYGKFSSQGKVSK
jgi:hypothetical protein